MRSHRQYWRRNLVAIALSLGVWALITFGVAFYGRELSAIDFFGWPFSFWVGAQGTLIVYVVIIVLYAQFMNRLDEQHERDETDSANRNGSDQ